MIRTTPLRLLAGLGVAGLAVGLAGCAPWLPVPTDTRSYDVSSDVHGVRLDSYGDLRVEVGDEPGLEVTAGDAAHGRIRIDEVDGILEIGMTGPAFGVPGRIQFVLTVEALDEIALYGAGDISAAFEEADEVSLGLHGAGDIAATGLDAERVRVELAGAGGVTLSGTSDRADVRVAGAGDADLSELEVTDAYAEVSGVGDIRVHASGEVEGVVSGAGDIRVTGGADVDRRTSGVGEIIEG